MKYLQTISLWVLAILWSLPLLYIIWAAFHFETDVTHFNLSAPLTLGNFRTVLKEVPFIRYMFNTFIMITLILIAQLIICTLAAYAFARYEFYGKNLIFFIVLLQLMIPPEVLIMKNYQIMANLGLVNTILGIGLPYMASAFGIFLLRQAFKTIPKELDDAAMIEGCSKLCILWKVYIPLSKPTYIAYALVSISYHWNDFLWPLIISSTPSVRPLTVGLAIFSSPETGASWPILSAATLISVLPLLLAFLLFQKQFINSFLYTGIK
jgi:sn-glycerol 3-phosphate transport system permease protein